MPDNSAEISNLRKLARMMFFKQIRGQLGRHCLRLLPFVASAVRNGVRCGAGPQQLFAASILVSDEAEG